MAALPDAEDLRARRLARLQEDYPEIVERNQNQPARRWGPLSRRADRVGGPIPPVRRSRAPTALQAAQAPPIYPDPTEVIDVDLESALIANAGIPTLEAAQAPLIFPAGVAAGPVDRLAENIQGFADAYIEALITLPGKQGAVSAYRRLLRHHESVILGYLSRLPDNSLNYDAGSNDNYFAFTFSSISTITQSSLYDRLKRRGWSDADLSVLTDCNDLQREEPSIIVPGVEFTPATYDDRFDEDIIMNTTVTEEDAQNSIREFCAMCVEFRATVWPPLRSARSSMKQGTAAMLTYFRQYGGTLTSVFEGREYTLKNGSRTMGALLPAKIEYLREHGLTNTQIGAWYNMRNIKRGTARLDVQHKVNGAITVCRATLK